MFCGNPPLAFLRAAKPLLCCPVSQHSVIPLGRSKLLRLLPPCPRRYPSVCRKMKGDADLVAFATYHHNGHISDTAADGAWSFFSAAQKAALQEKVQTKRCDLYKELVHLVFTSGLGPFPSASNPGDHAIRPDKGKTSWVAAPKGLPQAPEDRQPQPQRDWIEFHKGKAYAMVHGMRVCVPANVVHVCVHVLQAPETAADFYLDVAVVRAVGQVRCYVNAYVNALCQYRIDIRVCFVRLQAFREGGTTGMGFLRTNLKTRYTIWRRAAIAAARVMYFRGDGECPHLRFASFNPPPCLCADCNAVTFAKLLKDYVAKAAEDPLVPDPDPEEEEEASGEDVPSFEARMSPYPRLFVVY